MKIKTILMLGLIMSLLLLAACSKSAVTTDEPAVDELSDEQLTEEVESTVETQLVDEEEFVEIGDMI